MQIFVTWMIDLNLGVSWNVELLWHLLHVCRHGLHIFGKGQKGPWGGRRLGWRAAAVLGTPWWALTYFPWCSRWYTYCLLLAQGLWLVSLCLIFLIFPKFLLVHQLLLRHLNGRILHYVHHDSRFNENLSNMNDYESSKHN